MPYPYHQINEKDIKYFKTVVPSRRMVCREDIKEEYFHDEMPEYGVYVPDLFIEAVSKEEVSAIMRYSYENNIPVTARGAGTGLAGGATCKYGGIMLSLMKMNRILEIDNENLTITVEPGALLSEVADAAKSAGLFYPPDPGERTASIGGTVITNAGGMRAVRYGVTRDYVRAIEAVLPDGEIVNFSSNVVKNTTGYALKDLVIGSEGTLCILTKVTLRLIPAPKFTWSIVVPYDEIETCIETVPKLLQMSFIPTAIEFLETELLDIIERHLNKSFPHRSANAYLIVMFDAVSREEIEKMTNEAAKVCIEAGAQDALICNSDERSASVWSVRAAVLEGMKADSIAQEECDVVVPRPRIADFVKAAKNIGKKYGIRIMTVGHAGDGNIHTEMLRDKHLSEKQWKSNTKACLKELYALSKELGGQLSGEHGIGNGRLEFLEDFIGDRMYRLFQSVKLAFDEKNILNPGKLITFEKTIKEDVLNDR
ncbi:putative FAD-linked oxidoreductase [Oxobacter pfennigii]|uniref:Putative FAD-linked oxidoreductase n=1 Tax=Oxobacter pfennigii TaxID=36849 RepID=A0A0P9AE67_9CLOT|nr:FAD-binding oxidoreductase [Oxobacter pfennigii]KPU43571.1 putative FAD-linked oxidoreductase [Oxobacter pfennigii]